jgi:large repetitive protein
VIIALVCIGVAAVLVAVNRDASIAGAHGTTATPNTAPIVSAVTVAAERIFPGDQCQLFCEATDNDGDTLVYSWSASQGHLAGEGATAKWTAPETEGLYRVSVTVDDGSGGTDTHSISLSVKDNTAPEFQSAPSYTEGIRPGASVSVSCPAVDADGDAITYAWHAAYGELQGEGDSVVWNAPEELGSYVVTVSARDAYGAEAKRDILVSVTPSLTPRLGEFVVEAVDHEMLKYEMGVWDIFIGRSCSIECVVLEGDAPFTYTWSADEGTLTTDGAVATWQAPRVRGQATIKVDVTDALGNTRSGQVLMYAEDCTCAFA